MAVKKETQFANKVIKLLPTTVYAEKTHNIYRGGVWDYYFESPSGFLWVEFKHCEKLPPVIELQNQKKSTKLSILQIDWGRRMISNNIPCAVCMGVGIGRNAKAIWWADNWEIPLKREDAHLYTLEEAASLINLSIRRNYK